MAVKVRIPSPLQKLTNNQPEVQCVAKNVNELLADLEKKHPGVKERLCDADGKLRRLVQDHAMARRVMTLEECRQHLETLRAA